MLAIRTNKARVATATKPTITIRVLGICTFSRRMTVRNAIQEATGGKASQDFGKCQVMSSHLRT
jgi:hypothetical protein